MDYTNKNDLQEGTVSIKNPNFSLTADGSGWLKDNEGRSMCVKVEASWPVGTFAQGIKNIFSKSDGGIVIVPTGSKIENIDMSKDELISLARTITSGKPFKTNKSGATITIGKSLVNWCKSQW